MSLESQLGFSGGILLSLGLSYGVLAPAVRLARTIFPPNRGSMARRDLEMVAMAMCKWKCERERERESQLQRNRVFPTFPSPSRLEREKRGCEFIRRKKDPLGLLAVIYLFLPFNGGINGYSSLD